MLLTTFFIDGIREVSIQTPSGTQEDGGVYGNSQNYSTWILGENGDTTDFVDVLKTVILYGNLYKITLDTGNMFNPTVPGGTPNLVGFMNMDLQNYWENIVNGTFKLNGVTYDEYGRRVNIGVPGNRQIFPSLLEFSSGVKQEIGWVEINRTRNSIYYESCDGGTGRLARSDQFYDMDYFIMTKNLFNPNTSNIGNFLYNIDNTFIAEVVPTISLSNQPIQTQGSSRAGIQPIGEINQNDLQQFYFDNIPYPNRFRSNNNANEYLKQLFLGVRPNLDATINDGPFQTNIPSPLQTQRNPLLNNVPLLLATAKQHSIGGQEFVTEDQTGQTISVWPGYSKSIWAQYRLSPTEPSGFEQIENGFRSTIDSSSRGRCRKWSEDGGATPDTRDRPTRRRRDTTPSTRKRSRTESDPLGIDEFKLDIPYEDFYEKMPCPTKKKLKGNDCVSVLNKTSYQIDPKDTLQVGGTRVIPVGAFNPDSQLSFITQDIDRVKFIPLTQPSYIGNAEIRYNIIDVIYRGPANKKIDDSLYEVMDANNKNISPLHSSTLAQKNRVMFEVNEQLYGIRENNSLFNSSAALPYGTYKMSMRTNNGINELRMQQVGAECLDKGEFYKSVNFLKQLSRTSVKKPIGVNTYGYPIFSTDDKLKGAVDSLLRDLFGVAEIIINGSDVKKGWYTTTEDGSLQKNKRIGYPLYNPTYELRQAIVTPLYVESDITVGGQDVDENTDNGARTSRAVTSGGPAKLKDIVYVNVGPVTNVWTKESVEPGMDQKKMPPYLSQSTLNSYKKYNLNDEFEWGAFVEDSKSGFKQIILDPNVDFTDSEKKQLSVKILKIDELKNGKNKSQISNAGKPYKYKNTKRLATTYESTDGYDTVIVPPTYYEYDYDNKCHKMDFDTNQKPGYSKFYGKCGEQQQSDEPIVNSDYPVINGWMLEGLYHRDARWGDRYGLIMTPQLWSREEASRCNCGTVDTGGWIKVNPGRIRLEKHTYNDRDMYWYNNDFNEGYVRDLIDELKLMKSSSTGNPLYNNEQILYLVLEHRSMHDWIVQNVNGGNITLFLRPNSADQLRGLKDLNETLKGRSFDAGGGFGDVVDFIPDGLFEERVYVNYASEFGVRYRAEPGTHTSGEFDKTQTYRAVFRKFVSGKTAPDAIEKGTKLLSTGISDVNEYKPTAFNKKVACELLYVVESVYKMHRARLKKLNDLIKNQIDAYGVTYKDSPSESINPRFDYYLSTVKKMHQLYKEKFGI